MNSDTLEVVADCEVSELPCPPNIPRGSWFFYAGVVAGCALGVYEAVLLHTRPAYSIMERPDIGPLIFLAAPLVDILVLGLWGFGLACIAKFFGRERDGLLRVLSAAGLGLAGGLACGISLLRFDWDQNPSISRLAHVVVAGTLAVAAVCLIVLHLMDRRRPGFIRSQLAGSFSRLRWAALIIGVVLLGSIGSYQARGLVSGFGASSGVADAGAPPNIVLITIDTAAASHFSCYGYSRNTTPNIDRLARQGVRFENAISASSWTLPSFASMFTGLLPHQHGASGASPLSPRFPTIAAALKSKGYQTAGFNANFAYGQASQGIAQGFEVYEDGSESLSQNLHQTLAGRAFVKFVYLRLGMPDSPDRQGAEEVNQKVYRWFAHRERRPYFLLVNYFDVHYPYVSPPAFATRFGGLPGRAATEVDTELATPNRNKLTDAEQSSLVAAYDDTLAYADSQIGALMQVLQKSPDWANTIVIVTSDHGEAFGQHGHYGHGWNLNREVVHVPLIMLGRGIPVGLKLDRLVGSRRLYATILDLADGSSQGFAGLSPLQKVWSDKQGSSTAEPVIVSELEVPTLAAKLQNDYLSVTTPQWHLTRDAHGRTQLYDWVKDPEETTNLVDSPENSAVVDTLQQTLRDRITKSAGPWAGLSYLQPVGLGKASAVNSQIRDDLDSLPYK
jgi:arylsulfatase A-like enzyme